MYDSTVCVFVDFFFFFYGAAVLDFVTLYRCVEFNLHHTQCNASRMSILFECLILNVERNSEENEKQFYMRFKNGTTKWPKDGGVHLILSSHKIHNSKIEND